MIKITKLALIGLSFTATAAYASAPIAAACCAIGACCGLDLGCC